MSLRQGTGTLTDVTTQLTRQVTLRLEEDGLSLQIAGQDNILRWKFAEIESPRSSSHLSRTVRHSSTPFQEVKIDSTFLYDSLAERASGVAVRIELVPDITRDWKAREKMWQSLTLNRWRALWIGPQVEQESYLRLMQDKMTRLGILIVVVLGAGLASFW
jgi:hypothetical protein